MPFEASLARMSLEILENVRKELHFYRQLQRIYEVVSEAPASATPEEVRRDCCIDSAGSLSWWTTSSKARRICRRNPATFLS